MSTLLLPHGSKGVRADALKPSVFRSIKALRTNGDIMVRYRFETSSLVRELQVDASSMTEKSFLQHVLQHIFKDKQPPFELKLVGSMDDEVILLRRCYTSRFKKSEKKEPPAVVRKKRKRRWKSPEPLLEIMRKRGYYIQ